MTQKEMLIRQPLLPLLKMGKRFDHTLPKTICRWQISTWRDTQYYYPWGKFKLKPQDTYIHPLEWLKYKTLYIPIIWSRYDRINYHTDPRYDSTHRYQLIDTYPKEMKNSARFSSTYTKIGKKWKILFTQRFYTWILTGALFLKEKTENLNVHQQMNKQTVMYS